MIFRSEEPYTPVPEASVYDLLFEGDTNIDPKKPCYISAEDPSQIITYAELKQLILKLVVGLKQAVPDFTKGDVVAIYSPNNIYYPPTLLGVVTAGGAAAAIDHSSDAETAASCLETVKAKIIIAHPDTIFRAKQAAKIVGILTRNIFIIAENKGDGDIQTVHDAFWAHGGEHVTTPIKLTKEEFLSSPCYFYFTSGTTGKKKAVAIPLKAIANVLTLSQIRIPNVTALTYTELHHASGLVGTMHLNIRLGRTTYILKTFSFDQFYGAIQKYKINAIFIQPWVAAIMVQDDTMANQYDFSSLMTAGCTGSACNEGTFKAFHQRFKIPIVNIYGMTETFGCFRTNFEKTLKGSVGNLAPGYNIKLVDENGKELGCNEIGELCMQGPTVMSGYYNNPDANSIAFDEDGYFHTGDLFKVNEDGEFTHIDRVSDVIKYRSFKIGPQEIEIVLLSHPLVIDCAVVGCFSEKENLWLITAFVTLKKHSQEVEEVKKEILEITKAQLSDLKQIRGGLYVLEDLPKNNTGKIDRRALRQYKADMCCY